MMMKHVIMEVSVIMVLIVPVIHRCVQMVHSNVGHVPWHDVLQPVRWELVVMELSTQMVQMIYWAVLMMKNVMMEILTHEMAVVQVVRPNIVVMGIVIVTDQTMIIYELKSVIYEEIMVSCEDYVLRPVPYQMMSVSFVTRRVTEGLDNIIFSYLLMCQEV